MYEAIPAELKALHAWVCAKADKNLCQVNGQQAMTDRPDTWNSFEACAAAVGKNGITGIGLVLIKDDPYFIIDLDKTASDPKRPELHRGIHDTFDTYSELSVSGTGCHIVGKGALPFEDGQAGFRNKEYGVEAYSAGHYLIFTGRVYANKPIAERQELLNKLQQQFRPVVVAQEQQENRPTIDITDEDLIAKICLAANGEIFKDLYYNGYPTGSDRSSTDLVFMNFMAFYNVGQTQAIRLIKSSALATMRANGPAEKRKKFNRADYLIDTYQNAVSKPIQQAPSINFDGLREALEAKLHQPVPEPTSNSSIPLPPGLLGEIAQFIYEASPRPVPEISIAGAIGLMAGICGNAYNVTGTGLNQYILCLARTGIGKDAASSGIDKIVNEVIKQVPVANEFIGPSEIASGQALIKYIGTRSQCFLSVIGEFGIKLKMMSDVRASAADQSLRRTLLQLYTKSGAGQIVRESIYADKDKNTSLSLSPSLSILAESTPETVYEAINDRMVLDGLLPRFIIINYEGKRRLLNDGHELVRPSQELITSIGSLMAHCKTMNANKKVIGVEYSPKVIKLLKQYDVTTTDKINNLDNNKTVIELWNRAHIKIVKLASLLAVGVNMNFPVITEEMFYWAKNVVETSIHTLAKKFESGEVGHSSNDLRQSYDLKRIIKQYITSPYDRYKNLGYITKDIHHKKIILHKFLNQRTFRLASYKDDDGRGRASEYLNKVIKSMIDNGELIEVSKIDMRREFKNDSKAYIIGDITMLDGIDAEG